MTAAKMPWIKYTTEELMELIDIFQVSPDAQHRIREILDGEAHAPDAGNFFRYYNPRSKVEQFEKQTAQKVGSKHVLAVNSGTSALVASLVAGGVGPGTEVIVPGYTFFASASAVVVAKAVPVIVDIDETLTMDPAAVVRAITPRTRAIMPVHMLGLPSNMDAIMEIARKHNLLVIEDAAQAFGGKYKGRYLGTIGDTGCVSLDAYKVIGTGEGGLVLTNDDWLYTRAQSYHDTAACWRSDRYAVERKTGELFCGENYRMPETCAAVGLAQLRKLDQINQRTNACWTRIRSEAKLPACARWAPVNDPAGVCGYNLAILFDQHEQAVKAITAKIGLGGLAAGDTRGVRDWHVYWNWEHILEQKTATPEGCPFKCPHVVNLPDYRPDMCPRTRDIIRRLAVVGISPAMTDDEASAIAAKLTTDLSVLWS
ncbi:MAG: DegT/DnrJ/EryC1/StrS family aminotransferase [Phycisphaeraceae bacterium]|nr:DegT/DnrJ/EryC1/StrS family aminotransferase [Phycisphaeraceae bacterium]